MTGQINGILAVRGRKLSLCFLGIAAIVLLLRRLIIANQCGQNDDEYQDQGERVHIQDEDCWCHPVLFFDGGDEFGDVWCHKGEGDELPPPKILAEVIADAMRNEEEE